MLESLGRLFRRRPRAATPDALEAFLARQAAFVTQKTVIDYCRVKAGRAEQQTFADPDFKAALRHCRWQTFAGAVQDVTALAEAWLRPHVPGREAALAVGLVAMAARVIDAATVPPEEHDGLQQVKDALPRHLASLQEKPAFGADRLPLLAEAPLLATLPIHADQRIGETPSIRGALRFHIVTTQEEMERGFDAAGLAARLAGG
jgi:hypothetical protein